MGEGKTNMFGKTYNTIGSTDSNFIIKTKGDLKVQWGNKYIDVIKNGKIASEGSKILFVVNSPEEVKQNGVYIVTSTEGNELWVCIDGIKIQIANTSEETTYVSFLVEQKATAEQKHQALTNIGFYYETLSEAKAADIVSGIIYVENDNKLYIAKNGTLTEYLVTTSNTYVTGETQENKKYPLYIQNYSLWVDGLEYIRCTGDIVQVLKQLTVHQMVQSANATEEKGFRLYIDNQDSILEIDRIIWRKYPNPITYKELQEMIKTKTLNPKMYYLLTDFQNPWEVSWDNESMFYEDQYAEINKVKHLSGLRNAMQIIVQAISQDNIDKQVWSPLHPEWVIHYDYTFKGPEHKITVDGVEQTYYGYRSKTDSEGKVTYLSCKGQITYLKDELGNEGNFNFRQFMFKRDSKYRYCMDISTDKILGKFSEGRNNKFILQSIDSYMQVFQFNQKLDSSGKVISYDMVPIDSNMQLSKGHNLVINSECPENNIFELEECDDVIYHNLTNTINNSFINIKKEIHSNINIKDNIFKDINGSLTITIECFGNKLEQFANDVIIQGISFNNNCLSNFSQDISNTGTFNNNTINKSDGLITNLGLFCNNIIDQVVGQITNNSTFENNTILNINNLINNNIFSNNSLDYISDNDIQADITYNNIKKLESCYVYQNIENNIVNGDLNKDTFNGLFKNNKIDSDIVNSTISVFTDNIVKEAITELISSGSINDCRFRKTINKLTTSDLIKCQFDYIDNLELNQSVYYTQFHGYIGNISRQLTDLDWELLSDPAKKTEAYPNIKVVCVPDIIVKGMILMWYGQEDIPHGWHICDGTNGTPNLIDKFIRAGYSSEEVNPEGVDEENRITLNEDNLPEHHHQHKPHKHDISMTGTTGNSTVSVSSNETFANSSSSYSISSGGESSSSVVTSVSYGMVYSSGGSHSHSIDIYGSTDDAESEEQDREWLNKPIKIEPRHYKLIFIMKIE